MPDLNATLLTLCMCMKAEVTLSFTIWSAKTAEWTFRKQRTAGVLHLKHSPSLEELKWFQYVRCASWHLGIIQTWVSYSFEVQSACYVSLQKGGWNSVCLAKDISVYCRCIWGKTGWWSLFIYLFSYWFNCCSLLDVLLLKGLYVLHMQICFSAGIW